MSTDTEREAARAFFQAHVDWLWGNWGTSFEGQEYREKFLGYVAALATPPAAPAPTLEDYCGVQHQVRDTETRRGTAYRIAKWTCPRCAKPCSMLELDGEWCHGDSMSISFIDGVRTVSCGACWLGGTRPDVGVINAELLAALRLYVNCGFGESADPIKQGEAYDATIRAIANATTGSAKP